MSAPAVVAPAPPVTSVTARALPLPRPALAAHVASLGVAAAGLMYLTRHVWFFADDWEFLARRRVSPVGIWVPHNEHWSTIPLLVYRALYAAVGLRTYVPYLAVLVGLHLVATHLLWRWMRRCGADDRTATALAAMFLLIGAAWECLVYPFAMNFSGAVVFGLAALLAADHDGRPGRRDLLAVALAILALAWSGVAITMVAVVGIAVLLRRGIRDAALVVAPPALVYAVWFVAVGHTQASTTPATATQLLQAPAFVWTGLTHDVEAITGLAGAGPVLLIGLLVVLLRHPDRVRGRRAAAAAAALGAVVFMIVAAVGRVALGIDAAGVSRYVYVVGALLLIPCGAVLTRLGRSSVAASVVVLALIGGATLQGAGQLVTATRARVAALTPPEHQILAAARLVQTGAPLLAGPSARPEPVYSFDMDLAALRLLVAEDAFGDVPEQPALSRLAAALQLQVVAGARPAAGVADGPAPRVVGVAGATAGPGCIRLTGSGPVTLRLRFGAPAAVSLTPGAGGSLEVTLATAAAPSVLSAPRSFPLSAGRATWLSVAAADADPVLTLPAGDDLVCGVTG